MDDDQIREFSEKMSVRIASLEDRNDKLLETARRVEGEKRYAETELVRLQKEIRRLKQELDRLKSPPVTYGDIGGLEIQMRELREAVEDPLLKPDLYRKVGIEPPKGVLLVGPPGTGKTLLAKAVANRTQATFIRFVGSELVQKYIG